MRPCGWKLGMTSGHAQRARGLNHPIVARLFEETTVRGTGAFIAPGGRLMVEAEYAVELSEDLPRREPGYSIDDLESAIANIYPAIEVCFSRFATMTALPLPIVVADNSYHGGLVLGPAIENWRELDYPALDVRLLVSDGQCVEGQAMQALGDPLELLRWLATQVLPERGLKAGDIIATGAFAIAHLSGPCTAVADFGALGQVWVEMRKKAGADVIEGEVTHVVG